MKDIKRIFLYGKTDDEKDKDLNISKAANKLENYDQTFYSCERKYLHERKIRNLRHVIAHGCHIYFPNLKISLSFTS